LAHWGARWACLRARLTVTNPHSKFCPSNFLRLITLPSTSNGLTMKSRTSLDLVGAFSASRYHRQAGQRGKRTNDATPLSAPSNYELFHLFYDGLRESRG